MRSTIQTRALPCTLPWDPAQKTKCEQASFGLFEVGRGSIHIMHQDSAEFQVTTTHIRLSSPFTIHGAQFHIQLVPLACTCVHRAVASKHAMSGPPRYCSSLICGCKQSTCIRLECTDLPTHVQSWVSNHTTLASLNAVCLNDRSTSHFQNGNLSPDALSMSCLSKWPHVCPPPRPWQSRGNIRATWHRLELLIRCYAPAHMASKSTPTP